jgi:deoxyribodipyrimidine photo-lyase
MDLLTRTADFTPTRAAALSRLNLFLPQSGARYRDWRNHDLGVGNRSNVSALSPHIRHRLISEHEVCRAVLGHFAASTAEKFIQEVFWRTYWKGWLEMRPAVWARYLAERDAALIELAHSPSRQAAFEQAVAGRTGIDCFDAWANELVETGYLHNHARMWFASIWIFTLRLPWSLGADFFLRHLMDGDAASNTLSWRWVGGLHTRGKTYLARAANIAEYTDGRFRPSGLAAHADALAWDEPPAAAPLPLLPAPADAPSLLVVTDDDCTPEMMPQHCGFSTLSTLDQRSNQPIGASAAAFSAGALDDARKRLSASGLADFGHFGGDDFDGLVEAAHTVKARQIVLMHPPVGPGRDALQRLAPVVEKAGLQLGIFLRRWDRLSWPHARSGFFTFKEKIPDILADAGS